MEDSFSILHTFGAAYETAKGYSRADLMPQKHQCSVKSDPKKNQDFALNVVDHTSRANAQQIKVTPITSSKTTRKLTIL